jgi:hypothetical protein
MSHPNQPSILEYASQSSEEAVAAPGQRVQALVSAATEVAKSLFERTAEQARQAQAASDAERRQFERRQDAAYEADRLVWRRVWDDRFWQHATPEKVARAWEACVPWAMADFPSAKVSADHIRAQIKDRYGVEIESLATQPGDLLTLLAAAPATDAEASASGDAQTGAEATAETHANDGPERLDSIRYVIRDLNTNVTEHIDVVHLASDEGEGVAWYIVAQRLEAFSRRAAEERGGPAPFAVDVYTADDPDKERFLFHLEAHQAVGALQLGTAIAEQSRSEDAASIKAGASPGAEGIAEVLQWTRRQLREELRTAQSPEQAEDIRDRLGHLSLRLQAARADARGEDGAVVYNWAHLRRELDQDWWEQATVPQAAAVWEQVDGWAPGRVRDQAHQHLRNALHRRFGTQVPAAATADQVRELLAEQTAPATPTTSAAAGTTAREPRQAAAEQDRAAAEVYQEMAANGAPPVREAAQAATTVARAFTAAPADRLEQAAQQDQPSAVSGGTGHSRGQARESDSPSR